MKFSNVIAGLIIAGAGSLVVSFGLSESCSSEILAKISPFLGTVPGLAWAYIARLRMGGVNLAGFRKDAANS